ncbi:probable LRR receptor-like serine/threonine-protein kinase At1g06840 [Alnus glutinosa]|uniref:probable LRR receptor-like serine/threonine-protein kinase At1g06840 n=1 Tax=Alnus glutinosa TaxID=3517 RepID=UPI002D76F927|nr:probable LRR receptor-like serine/threonine-protein kinase At1g06840 [Alnus glutinosa]XP_062171193.1 probable LRR receptor-like serine/threonine-protein kinase At1g06840 [Alnus glutinosa]
MYPSRAWTYGLLIVACLSWSSLLIGAQRITNPSEVTALRAIKARLIDPNKNLSNWDRGDPCTSNWTGVVCHNATFSDDGYLHVDRLQLIRMNLSGSLSPALGQLLNATILDFMWNKISGSIPKEIGNIKSLFLLLLNGNQLTGPLPEELGYLPKLDRIQIDQNNISGPIPTSFSNLNLTKHFHMNNNSISGQIPPELSRLPNLFHFLLDNNNLSGILPPSFSELPNLRILQLDNNNFDGASIPPSYSNMSNLLKLSLRNCNLQGPIPDFSQIPNLYYLDLSSNQLNGSIPANRLAENVTTIYLSNNNLEGPVPTSFSSLPRLQRLSIANNSLNGSIPSSIWQNKNLTSNESLIVELQNNQLSNVTGPTNLPQNVSVWLQGNPLCSNSNLVQFCGSESDYDYKSQGSINVTFSCSECPPPYEYSPTSPKPCLCAAPLLVGYRLKSPGFTDFRPFKNMFEQYMTSGLGLFPYQLYLDSFTWVKGPRLGMFLKLFPDAYSNDSNQFNQSEVQRVMNKFTSWGIPDDDLFGPYELMDFILSDVYKEEPSNSPRSTLSKGALAGIVLGTIAGAVTLSAVVTLLILRVHMKKHPAVSRRRRLSRASMKIDGVKDFTYGEMAMATNNFNSSTQIGQGGYGKVYKGILADGTVVAIKRAQEGSLQGEKEFLTEIELLSRLHHRNLVSLIGYCDEEGEQMLVYEFMPRGTLRDQLSAKSKEPLSFDMRLGISLGSAKGILYLHTEANPPIFHRDIKASNILLDSNYTAKVADFGLSRLAPVPIEGVVPAHVSTVVKGTPGYLDPEYFLTHQLTDKSDVYSLGVVFLELLTGMQPISHGKNIVREVNIAYQSGMIFGVIDGRMGSYPSDCVVKFLSLALKCCQDETDARPSMAEVVRELENIWVMMPESDIRKADPMVTDVAKDMTPPSSSSNVKNPFVSMDLSGSNLDSGVIPTITPR